MDEVRSYWQVASISHFCTIFNKPFKLPIFEPEELDQAFILDIPAPKPINNISSSNINHNNNINSNNNSTKTENDHNDPNDPEWLAPDDCSRDSQNGVEIIPQPQSEEQQELHLLVKLAIALLKPHFNCKISQNNWELYLRRLVDTNWVELENHPSPFRVPLLSQDGVELTKNLGFNELPLSDKIDLFYALCDYRLWCEDAVDALKDFSVEELRLESIGKDSQGYEYWYFSGTRLFRENKELSHDIIMRKKRIKELEYGSIELEKNRIFREQEEKRKAEVERARQLAAEAREARLAIKKQQEQEANKKRKSSTLALPPRTGLRERRSSTTSNNNQAQLSRTPTTRSKQPKQTDQQQQPHSAQKGSRSLPKHSKFSDQDQETLLSPELPKVSPEEECQEELKRLAITKEDRAEAWCIQCESLEDWESFATKFEKTKSTNEKYLSSYINNELLPNIRAIYARRAAEVRRKEKELILSLASRRVSTRIITKKAQEEEEERQAQLHEMEMRRKKVEAETRLRAELEREMRIRMNKFVVNGGVSSTCSDDGDDTGGYKLRQHQHLQTNTSDEFEGIIHPDNLSEFYEALELVIDTVRTSKHAWPFVDPVPNTVPGYYDLIKDPMDLRKLRTKIEFREYKSLIELEKDFQILVNNCEKFNGPRNVYTKMVYKLWKSLRKNVRLYLQRDLSMDEYETFIYPPPPPPVKEMSPSNENVSNHENHNEVKDPDEFMQVELQEEVTQEESYTNQTSEKIVKNQIFKPAQEGHLPATDYSEANTIKVEQHEILNMMNTEEEPKAPTPEPITVGEEIIIDSYDVPIPDESFFLMSQDTRPL